jgi:hypothetical protein
VRMLLDSFEGDGEPQEDGKQGDAAKVKVTKKMIPEMELRPYEHYDYVLVLCRTTFDWNYLVEKLELKRERGTNDDRYEGKVGLGRAIAGERLIALLKKAEEWEREVKRLRKRTGEDRDVASPAEALPESSLAASEEEFRKVIRGKV